MATNMDLADKIELDQLVTFKNTKTTWSITERLSPYPDSSTSYTPQSDSFRHSYVFRVELGGTSGKTVPEYIPKFAILKVKSRAASLRDAVDPALLCEIRALEQLSLNNSQHAPRILDAKVEHHLTSLRNHHDPGQDQTEGLHFVTYVLMTECLGTRLTSSIFAKLSHVEQRTVYDAFRTALTDIHRSWVIPTAPASKHLLYDSSTSKICITNYENALTFNNQAHQLDPLENISRSLPTRYQTWDDEWYSAWGLTLPPPPSSDEISTAVVEEGKLDAARDQEYRALVLREPKMPGPDVVKVLLTGEAIIVNAERREYMEQMALLSGRRGGECCSVM